MFRVITRKIVEQKNKKDQSRDCNSISSQAPGSLEGLSDVQGSFKLTNKRQSWLGIASTPGNVTGEETDDGAQNCTRNRKGKCC